MNHRYFPTISNIYISIIFTRYNEKDQFNYKNSIGHNLLNQVLLKYMKKLYSESHEKSFKTFEKAQKLILNRGANFKGTKRAIDA